MATRSNRIREPKPTRLARRIGVPEAQVIRGDFRIVDVQNHSEADQRHMSRSGDRKTVRRTPKLHTLFPRTLDAHQLEVCEWYASAHALAFDTIGVTARYGESNGGGNASFTHLARYKAQGQARIDFAYARSGVDSIIAPLLDRVVLSGRPIGRLNLSFRRAVVQLVERVEGMGVLHA